MNAKVVYFDESRGGRWFKPHAQGIRDYLVDEGFREVSSKNIVDWMKNAIDKGAYKTVIVFALDEVPAEVCGADSANVLIRKYLEKGGRVVWVGDIPFWSINKKNRESVEKWSIGLPQQILGVYPLIAEIAEPVKFTKDGEKLLSQTWYGIRPIAMIRRNGKWCPLFEVPRLFKEIRILAYSKTTY